MGTFGIILVEFQHRRSERELIDRGIPAERSGQHTRAQQSQRRSVASLQPNDRAQDVSPRRSIARILPSDRAHPTDRSPIMPIDRVHLPIGRTTAPNDRQTAQFTHASCRSIARTCRSIAKPRLSIAPSADRSPHRTDRSANREETASRAFLSNFDCNFLLFQSLSV